MYVTESPGITHLNKIILGDMFGNFSNRSEINFLRGLRRLDYTIYQNTFLSGHQER
jgi:hypothetical protein